MQIIKDARKETGWIEAVINGHWVEAKVYSEPSDLAIKHKHISKLTIAVGREWKGLNKALYHYDRGLDFNHIAADLLKKIISELENLPQTL